MRIELNGDGLRLDAAISGAVDDLSRVRVTQLIRDGEVRVNGVVKKKPSMKITEASVVEFEIPEPEELDISAEDLPLEIVFEDADLLVVNKAPGMVVHPSPGHPNGTLVNAVLFHADHLSGIGGVRRPGIVHRLDKGTSGLLVVAKSDRAHQGLAAQFADHSAGRRYLALCYGAPVLASGTIRSELGRHPYHRLRYASVESGGKPACTHWRVLARGERNSLIECRLETGRTHQVRVHLCESGWPLAGDPLYRRRAAQPTSALRPYLSEERPLLHAWHLSFIHPTDGQPRQFVGAVPADFAAAARAVGLYEGIPVECRGSAT